MYTFELMLNYAAAACPPLILHLHGGSDVEDQSPRCFISISLEGNRSCSRRAPAATRPRPSITTRSSHSS